MLQLMLLSLQVYVSFLIFLSFFQVGTEERIHVYYAHGEDNPKFVRRCYWLLDKYVGFEA